MTGWGQTEKNSLRANVFRSAPNIGHSSVSLTGLFGANCCREQVQKLRLQKPDLLDHLVGAGENVRRSREAERPNGCEVDDQLEGG